MRIATFYYQVESKKLSIFTNNHGKTGDLKEKKMLQNRKEESKACSLPLPASTQ